MLPAFGTMQTIYNIDTPQTVNILYFKVFSEQSGRDHITTLQGNSIYVEKNCQQGDDMPPI